MDLTPVIKASPNNLIFPCRFLKNDFNQPAKLIMVKNCKQCRYTSNALIEPAISVWALGPAVACNIGSKCCSGNTLNMSGWVLINNLKFSQNRSSSFSKPI